MVLEVSLAYQRLAENETALDTVDEIVYYYDLYRRTFSDEAYIQFIKQFNKYLEIMAPIKRIPGLASLVANNVEVSLWDADITPDELRSLLVNLLDLRYNGTHFEETRDQLIEISRELMAKPVVGDYLKTPDDAITLALLLLVISTNPY